MRHSCDDNFLAGWLRVYGRYDFRPADEEAGNLIDIKTACPLANIAGTRSASFVLFIQEPEEEISSEQYNDKADQDSHYQMVLKSIDAED